MQIIFNRYLQYIRVIGHTRLARASVVAKVKVGYDLFFIEKYRKSFGD